MAKFKGAVLSCVQCGTEFKVPQCRAGTAKTCSHACAVIQRGQSLERKVELTCVWCKEPFKVPQCHASRRVYCSSQCKEACSKTKARKASWTKDANPNWRGGKSPHSDGYVQARVPADHPFGVNGYILEHRLVMENWLIANDPTSKYLVEVGGRLYLSPKYHVHHKDEVKSNNDINNLQCMTPAEHRAHHNAIIKKALAFYRKHHPLGENP